MPRLLEFRERHPEVEVTLNGLWRAIVPAQDGETVICRYHLKDVLDKLEEVMSGPG